MTRFIAFAQHVLFITWLLGPPQVLAEPGGKPITLPGAIALQQSDLVPKHPNKKAITHLPFQVSEIGKLIAPHIKLVNGVAHIPLKSGQLVSLHKYIDELNKWEKYLNSLGYTLRDGPLALPRRPGERPPPVPQLLDPRASANNLGVVLMLKPKGSKDRRRIEVDKLTKPPFIEPVEDPLRRVAHPGHIVKPGERIDINLPGNLGAFNPGLALRKAQNFTVLLPDSVASNAPRVMSSDMQCSPGEVKGCSCVKGTPDCPDGIRLSPAGTVIIDCGAALNPVGGGESSTPSASSTASSGAACGEKTAQDPACLYDPKGKMHAKWVGINSCEKASGKDAWFNVGVCMEMGFKGDQDGASLALQNAGQSHFDIVLFGKGFKLLEADAFAKYDGQHSSGAKVFVPLTGEVLGPDGFSASYAMPPITIPIGGIANIVINGGGNARLSYKDIQFPFKAPPTACAAKDTGLLGLGLTQHAFANLKLSAALDAWVASAGVTGELILANDDFTLNMTDTIDPAHNAVTVQPQFRYDIQHLAGKVYLFVKISTLVYEKTFEVELFDFEGINPPEQIVPIEGKVFSSKLK